MVASMNDTATTEEGQEAGISPPDETPDSSQEVLWEAPPESRGSHGIWAERLKILIPKPGRWAIVQHYDRSRGAEFSAGNLRRQARNNKLPPGLWEFTSRVNHDKGGSDLYARWLGVPGEESARIAEQVEREYHRELKNQSRSGVAGEGG